MPTPSSLLMSSLRAFSLPFATTPPLPKPSPSSIHAAVTGGAPPSNNNTIPPLTHIPSLMLEKGRCSTSAGPRPRLVACAKARCSLSGSASIYVEGASLAFLKGPKRTHAVGRTGGTIRCATTEEINAEKALVEGSTKEKMEGTIKSVQTSFKSIRTGRSNPAMLDKIEVEYHGTPVGLKSIAQISTPDSSTLLIQPYDKSSLKMIEKAIVNSNLGMTPNNDGQLIRLIVPPLTEDRRKELTKQVAKHAEDGKIAIRNIRREAVKAYEKLKEKKLSEDNFRDFTDDIQKLTDYYIKKIDSIQKQKEKELLTV